MQLAVNYFLIFLFQFFFGINLYSQTTDSTSQYNMLLDSALIDSIILLDSLNTSKADTVFNANDTLKVFCDCWDNLNIFPYRTGAAPKFPILYQLFL